MRYGQGERDAGPEDPDYDDIFQEDVTAALLGIAGILGLLVVTAMTASVVVAVTLLRHL
jgi:hypothetical protein